MGWWSKLAGFLRKPSEPQAPEEDGVLAKDLAQGGGQLAEIASEAPRLVEAGVDADLLRRAAGQRDPKAARETLQQLSAVITSRLGPDDKSLAPILELLGFCTSKAEAVIARWSRAIEIRTASAGPHDPRAVSVIFTGSSSTVGTAPHGCVADAVGPQRGRPRRDRGAGKRAVRLAQGRAAQRGYERNTGRLQSALDAISGIGDRRKIASRPQR